MCGIYGAFGHRLTDHSETITRLADLSKRRGRDSSGTLHFGATEYEIKRLNRPFRASDLRINSGVYLAMGHNRLMTKGEGDNQPVHRDSISCLHNGIVLNEAEVWKQLGSLPNLDIDSEVLPAALSHFLSKGLGVEESVKSMFRLCKGSISVVFLLAEEGQLVLASNNGSLYHGKKEGCTFFASEGFALSQIGCESVEQVMNTVVYGVAGNSHPPKIVDIKEAKRFPPLLHPLPHDDREKSLLKFPDFALNRCSKCILPETMPFIAFDAEGVCNYCRNHTKRSAPMGKSSFLEALGRSEKPQQVKLIFPFSGGRDSSYGLHFLTEELGIRPTTYTYDWGMITDLGRRNISLMCSELGVENIVVAANLSKKRNNIRKNLIAWLTKPDLGMLNILTAGDKHFFKYVGPIQKELGATRSIWSFNPLETTHFKAGFLGIAPDFSRKKVYMTGLKSQIEYQARRLEAIARNPRYFNFSLLDTLEGEYYRSIAKQTGYLQLFDYFDWEESAVEKTLDGYGWERAPDTKSSWRIGDGTAAFYNYANYLMAGFTEHDTFRSNQIREGKIKRNEALRLARDENQPRYQNIKWYLDTIGLDFVDTIERINQFQYRGNRDSARFGL